MGAYVNRSDHVLLNTQLDAGNDEASPRKVSSDFDKVFRTFRYKSCQNLRDRIYGLLGLLDQSAQPQTVPDYTYSINQVFLDAVQVLMLQSEGDLRYMTGSEFHSKERGLPSWVRNFAASISQEAAYQDMERYEAYSLYNAAASTRANPRVIDDSLLSLTGTRIDKITHIGLPVLEDYEDSLWKVLLSWSDIVSHRDWTYRSLST